MTDPASTADEALARALDRVRARSSGRTRYEGCEPWDDELMLAEIERLRAALGQQAAVPSVRRTAERVIRSADKVYDCLCEFESDPRACSELIDDLGSALVAHDAATTPPAPDAGDEG